jgi:hypothetical protein
MQSVQITQLIATLFKWVDCSISVRGHWFDFLREVLIPFLKNGVDEFEEIVQVLEEVKPSIRLLIERDEESARNESL